MEKRVIVFRLLPEHGHHNATFFLSKLLLEKGFRVIYATNVKLQEHIISNGFEFYPIKEEEDPFVKVTGNFASGWQIALNKVKNIFHAKKNLKWARLCMEQFNYLEGVKRDLNPDLVIVDRCYGQMALNAFPLGLKIVQAETTVSTNKAKGVPPFTSAYIPKNTLWSNWICEFLWKRIFWEQTAEAFLYGSFDNLIRNLAKQVGYPTNQINFKRVHNPGFKMIPELIFSPEEFDFPHEKDDNIYYVGPPITVNRLEKKYHGNFNPFKESTNPTIYCAMGNLSHRYRGIAFFFGQLIKGFQSRKDLNLIVCIADDALRKEMETSSSPNIAFFKRVPQIDLLKEVDIMVNHGGMNSITECILNEVPMLTFPGTSHLDQYGNSSRIVYHKIGLRGKLQKDNSKMIMNKIDQLLRNKDFKKHIIQLKNKVLNNRNYEKGPLIIEQIIGPKPEMHNQPKLAHEKQAMD